MAKIYNFIIICIAINQVASDQSDREVCEKGVPVVTDEPSYT